MELEQLRAKKIYDKQYYQAHKDKIQARTKQYRQIHSEHCKKYDKQYYLNHEEKLKVKRKQRYQKNREKALAQAEKYRQENKEEVLMKRKQRYQENKEEELAYAKRYHQTERGKKIRAKANTKRRQKLGFNPLNEPFGNSAGHHINDNDVVFIPGEVHLSCYAGCNTKEHRQKVLDYYGSLENMIKSAFIMGFKAGRKYEQLKLF